MAIVFMPWIIITLLTAGCWTAINDLVYALIVLAAGYGIARAALPAVTPAKIIFLAPAVGILSISALSAFWIRLGLPLVWVSILWLGLAVFGVLGLWFDRKLWTREKVSHGGALVVFSVLISVVYFLPAARNDAVLRQDGSFNWIYVDTQYFYAMAACIENGGSPPKVPGAAMLELLYHFGPYVPSAVISRIADIGLGDALVRITHGVSLWALVLACFGLGSRLSWRATGEMFGGIMSVAGLFFYGSLSSLFTGEFNSSTGHVTRAILFRIPDANVLTNGGPFAHLILGHSMLNGLVAITAIMGLCLLQMEQRTVLTWRAFILLVLPALAIPMDSVAGLYALGVVGLLLFWGHLKECHSWLAILFMLSLFLAGWSLMGFDHSQDAFDSTINISWAHLAPLWWSLTVWFIVGLGFRIVGLRWISFPLTDPVAALVLASVLGLLGFWLSMQLPLGTERYGAYFLQSMMSIFAFSRVKLGFWRGFERAELVGEWFKQVKNIMFILTACGLFFGISAHVTHRHTGIASYLTKMIICVLFLSLLIGATALMKQNRLPSNLLPASVACVLMVGFVAWCVPWLNYGLGRERRDTPITAGEVRGLKRLGELSAPGERFATDKHTVDALAYQRERSYAYTALSERPALLEGYSYREVTALPWFETLLHNNDLMFTTTNASTLRTIANTYGVRWLVARPGSDISLNRPLPAWLEEETNSGDLKIYRVN